MQGKTARLPNRKAAAVICILAAMVFLLTGCRTGSVFDGSRAADASGFRMEYSMLNQEESADLTLREGDCLRVSLSHTDGSVNVTVGMEGQEPIYRGNGHQNAVFILEIAESGNYHISVSGHQAKGSISFTRIPGEKE